jgi:hypothetical protein
MITDENSRALIVPLLRQQVFEVCSKSQAGPVEIVQGLAEIICIACLTATADEAVALLYLDAVVERMRETIRLNALKPDGAAP